MACVEMEGTVVEGDVVDGGCVLSVTGADDTDVEEDCVAVIVSLVLVLGLTFGIVGCDGC